jgi:hypothetical protein
VHTKHEFLPPEPILRFSQRTCPILYFRSKTHVWGSFALYHCRRHPFRKRVSGWIQSTRFCHRNHFFVFRNEHAQSTTLGPKLMCWGGFAQFRCRTSPIPKTGVGVHTKLFCHRNQFFVFRNEHAQSSTLGPNSCLGWFRATSLPHVTHSENGCRGAYKARVFAIETISLFFATNMPNPQL